MTDSIITSSLAITIDGQRLEEAEGSGLLEVVVDQHAHLPGMFLIRLFDPQLLLFTQNRLKASQTVEIISCDSTGKAVSLMRGETTSVEPTFESDGARLVVRGFDPSYHMYRLVRTRTFVNVKDSDLAEQIAQEWRLTPMVDTTTQVYEHVFQRNQNDLSFLLQRAWRIGFECFVKDDCLYFRRPQPHNRPTVTLKWGFDLLTFRPRMAYTEQVNEVIVRGWDHNGGKPIIGRSQSGTLFAKTPSSPGSYQEEIEFGEGKLIIVDYPITTQAEADTLAKARMDELSGMFISAEGTAFRRPEIRAGEVVELEGVGPGFSGRFLITSARHVFTASDGLETTFLINGTRTGLLVDELISFDNMDRWYGVVTAVVTNNNDPKNLGRVKLKYPWLDTKSESNWTLVAGVGLGNQAGFFAPPSVDDQVLVMFEQGDFNRPVVIGSLPRQPFNLNTPLSEDGKTTLNSWRSASGHQITIQDGQQTNQIMVQTAKGHQIVLDDKQDQIVIQSSKGNKIVIDDSRGRIEIVATGDLALQSQGNLDLQAQGNLNLTASGRVKVQGTRIDLN